MSDQIAADFTGARLRIDRAAIHRDEMGKIRQCADAAGNLYVTRTARKSAVVLEAHYEPPLSLAIVFGEWLFNIRTALDYAFFQLAIEETGKNPPTRPGARMFPVKRTQAEFDALRGSDTFHGMSNKTIDMVEAMQPYHTKYGADGNALLWLHDLARRDRHRQPLTMGAVVTKFDAKAHGTPGVEIRGADKFDPTAAPAVVGTGESLWLASINCGSVSQAAELEQRVEVWVDSDLEIVEWYRDTFTSGTSSNIRNDSLEERMRFVEDYMRLALDHFETGLGRT